MGDINVKSKLTSLIRNGVHFEVVGDKLVVKGNLQAISNDDKIFLKKNKSDIISLIEQTIDEGTEIRSIDKDIIKPLSFPQKSLWLIDKINNGSGHYNITSAFKLEGELNYNAMRLTFNSIIQRHEVLRSTISLDSSGEPIQEVQEVYDFKIEIHEIPNHVNDIDSYISQKIQNNSNITFDLAKDVLLNVSLIKSGINEHILVVSMHHIASDGWSMGVLIKEVNLLYPLFVKGVSSYKEHLPDLKIQYSDFAYWQRERLNDSRLLKGLQFWKNQLANLPLLHNLPLDKPRPLIQRFVGDSHISHIDKSTTEVLNKLCKDEKASLFMGIYSVFSCLLSRYSGETDIVIGTPVANRERSEITDMIGFFMNLLVLRCDLTGNLNFFDLLKRNKQKLEELYSFQHIPFDRIVDSMKLKRSLNATPLFQVLLTLHNTKDEKFSVSGLTIEAIKNDAKVAKYDLSLEVKNNEEGMELYWEYNTDLFEKSTIINMADNFNTLLSSLVHHPEKEIFKAKLVDNYKIHKVVKGFQGVSTNLKEELYIYSVFKEKLTKHGKEIAIINNDVKYSYNELDIRIDQIASILLQKGVKNGDNVGICLVRNLDLIASIFACFKIGATYIPLDPIYSVERLQQIIEEVVPKVILTLSPLNTLYLNTVKYSDNIICLDAFSNYDKEINSELGGINVSNNAYVIFTSGSTGKPKGVEITHNNLNNLLRGFDISFESKNQIWLAQTSVNFDISVLELIWTISRGKTLVLQQTNPVNILPSKKLIKTNRKLDFGIMFFGADRSTTNKYDLLINSAKFADKNHFSSIWTPERHFGEFGGAFPSPSVLSSAIAMITKELKIRSGSVVLPLNDPIKVAEEWSLVDNLSGGRVGLSIASGWHPNDFVFSGSDYKNRHVEMRNRIVELKKLWKGTPIQRKNGNNEDIKVKIRPRPIQEEMPIWITSAGNSETFKYAGEIGANILTHILGQSIDQLGVNIKIYHDSLLKNGYKIEDKTVTLMLHTYIDQTEEIALEVSKNPFKEYLRSSFNLIRSMASELEMDIDTQKEEILEIASKRFIEKNTLIGSPETCQEMLSDVHQIGVTEVACLVDFGVEESKVLKGLEKIVETKNIFRAYDELRDILNLENQKTSLELIDEYQISHVQMTPSQVRLVLDMHQQSKQKSLNSVTHWFIGGEALKSDDLARLDTITTCKFYNMYGPTETTVWSSWREITPHDIAIGLPIVNTSLILLDKNDQPVPQGVIGELYIGGEGVAKGYFKDPNQTNSKFRYIENEFIDSKRYYKTGDLMRLKANNTFEYVGRNDNQVKINGHRVELEDVEVKICSHPLVKDAAVIIDNSKEETQLLIAYVVVEEHVSMETIKGYLHKKLPKYMIPSSFVVIDSIPLMPNGKKDGVTLSKMGGSKMDITKEFILPNSTTEEELLKIWRNVLELPEGAISTNDNFFDLGGNSFLAIKVLGVIKEQLDSTINIVDLYGMSNIRMLAEFIDNNTSQLDNTQEIEGLANTMEDAFNKFMLNETE